MQSLADSQKQQPALPPGTPTIGAIMAQPPPGFGLKPVSFYKDDLARLAQLRLMRGMRVYLNGNNTEMLLAGLEELGKRNWVVDFYVPEITDPRVARLLSQSPQTTFIVEHLGCGSVAGVFRLACRPRVHCQSVYDHG